MLANVIILALVVGFVAAFFAFLFDAFFGGLDFSTNAATAKAVIALIKQRHLESANFYDLGSCRGNFSISLGKNLPRLSILGIDDNRFRVVVAKLQSVFLKNINFKRQDIFKADVSSANIIFIYLPQELMPDLEGKLKKELKRGCVIITNKVSFPNWQPLEKFNGLSIYQI